MRKYIYTSRLLSDSEIAGFVKQLLNTTAWRQNKIKLFGKEFLQPRLSAWHADVGKTYSYSNLRLNSLSWTSVLQKIKAKVEALVHHSFNSVLVIYYRLGQNSIGWHADNEPGMDRNPVIASVSWGLPAGSISGIHAGNRYRRCSYLILLMQGIQYFWQHQAPENTRVTDARLNLTCRFIK